MFKRMAVCTILMCTVEPIYALQSPQESENQHVVQQRGDQSAASDGKQIRTDLEKMRVLLGQMQRNVAFVSAGDTPLKHQFQLEIEMWELLLHDLEKKLDPRDQ